MSDLHRERRRARRAGRRAILSSIRGRRWRRGSSSASTRCWRRLGGGGTPARSTRFRRTRRRGTRPATEAMRALVSGELARAGRGAARHRRDAAVREAAAHLVPAPARRRRRDTRSIRATPDVARRAPGAWWQASERRVKIGITCYPTYGGSGAVATELGIALAARGHEIHFITYQQPFRLPSFLPRDLLPRGGRRPLSAVRVSAVRPRARGAHARGRARRTTRPAARALRHPARDERLDRARDARARRGPTSRSSRRCTAPTSRSSGRIRRSTRSRSSRSRSRTASPRSRSTCATRR